MEKCSRGESRTRAVSSLVDATDLVIIATLVQTVVITMTLLVFIFQFRSQEKALRESSYQNLLGRYNDFMMSFIASPNVPSFYSRRLAAVTKKDLTPEDAAAYGHLMIACGIIEEAHALYRKGWIDKDNWQQWAMWLKSLSSNPEFAVIREITRGMFDRDFEEFIDQVSSEKKSE